MGAGSRGPDRWKPLAPVGLPTYGDRMKILSMLLLSVVVAIALPGLAGADPEDPTPAPTADEPRTPAGGDAAADAVEAARVVVFQTSWCPYCQMLRKHLDGRGVTYRTVDVEKDAAGREELARAFRWNGGIPVVRVDEAFVLGFDPDAVDAELVKAGLLAPETPG